MRKEKFRPLEFNPPVHGTWNIIHVGMQLPESMQVYVCAANCMRGVILTAAEMNALDRMSFVLLKEGDLEGGKVEEITIEGVTKLLRKREKAGCLPPAVILFTVCVHHFLGSDINYIYSTLRKRFPTVDFLRSYMDPIRQKKNLTPEQTLRGSMLDGIRPLPVKEKYAAILGDDFKRPREDELCALLRTRGYSICQIQDCETYAQFLETGAAQLLITGYPNALAGVSRLAERLDRDFLYLPATFSYAQLREQYEKVWALPGIADEQEEDIVQEFCCSCEALCEAEVIRVRGKIGDISIAVDATVHPRPFGLARYLAEHGFHVISVHADGVTAADAEDKEWLLEHTDGFQVFPTIEPQMRTAPRGSEEPVLAVGQKAAWFYLTHTFVDQVQGAGHYGYEGIRYILQAMEKAVSERKDPKDFVQKKGWGCDCCL